MGLQSLPAEPLTVARYLAVRAGDGASIATLHLATSTIAKVHQWASHESPCRDQGVRASLKGWGRRLARPQRQAGVLTVDVLAVTRLTAVQPRLRGRGFETAEQAAERASNCVGCQERWAISAGHEPRHVELFLTMAFRMVSSLRMPATKATFFALPAASSLW